MNKQYFMPGLVALLLMSTFAVGCGEQRPLKTGTINSTIILQQDDHYQELAQSYFDERTKAAYTVEQTVKQAGGEIKDQATYDKLRKLEADLEAKWLKTTRQYTEEKMVLVSAACDKVCKEKQIDIVLLDSSEMPVCEYGSVDITQDILQQMPGFAGGSDDNSKTEAASSQEKPAEKTEAGK